MSELEVLQKLRLRLAETCRSESRRLPPERQLAVEYNISRAKIRKMLAVMESEGHLRRRVGCGTFVQVGDEFTTINIGEITQKTGPREAMEARLVLEPHLAGLAAINATTAQIASLWALSRLMRKSPELGGIRK